MFKKENNNITRHSELVSESIKNKALHSTGLFADAHPSYLGTAYGVACRHRIKSGMTRSGESGRSMVEMLGVLAVIGILSVAGIAGYKNAMNKHRANELLYEASKRATVVAMQAASGKTGAALSVAEFGNDGWAVTTQGLTGQFGIVSPSTSTDVCKQVVNAVGTGTAIKQVLSGATDTTGDASKCSDAALTLVYNNDLTSAGNETSPGGCPKAGYTGDNCDEKILCKNGGTWTENGCECPSWSAWTGADCSTCGGYKNVDRVCNSCDYSDGPDGAFYATPEECNNCNGLREINYDLNTWVEGYYYCIVKDCGTGNFRSPEGYCHPCDYNGPVHTTAAQCDKCDNTQYPRKMVGSECVPNW